MEVSSHLFARLPVCFTRPMLSWQHPVLLLMLLDDCREPGELLHLSFHMARSPPDTPKLRIFTDAAASPLPEPSWDHGQLLLSSPTCPPPGVWGQTTGHGFSPGCDGDQKMDECREEVVVWMCTVLHSIPRSRGLAGLIQGKGCWLLLQAPAASCSGPVCGGDRLPNQPLLPDSSLQSGRSPCAAGSKPGAACAP